MSHGKKCPKALEETHQDSKECLGWRSGFHTSLESHGEVLIEAENVTD